MIRNVVLGRLRDPNDPAASAQLDEGLAGIAALDLPGQISMQVGRDAQLRDGAWTFAIVNDWSDAESYRTYDTDEDHNRYRRLIVEVCEVARVQLAID
jgi:hypothetical protein